VRAARVLGYDLAALTHSGPQEKLTRTCYAQPAIFVTNFALYAALGDALTPSAGAGHSFGEYCSLAVAGALSFEDALLLVKVRGLAMEAAAELAPGGMSAILGLGVETIRELVARASSESGRVQIANFNTPTQIVVSGDLAAVRHVGELASSAGAKRVVPLNVSGAWHSELMLPARESFESAVADAMISLPRFPVISNVDAQRYTSVQAIRTNLVRSVTDEVLWHQTLLRIFEERLDLIVEFGAQAVLAPMMKRMSGAPPAVHVGDSAGVVQLLERLGASVHA
jgi:[acyl-carrier-protein] S-malonyltransferase